MHAGRETQERFFLQDSSSFLLLKLSTNLIKGNIRQNINKKTIPLYGLPTQRDISIKKSFLPLQNGKVFECRNHNTNTNNHLCMTNKVNMGRANRVTTDSLLYALFKMWVKGSICLLS